MKNREKNLKLELALKKNLKKRKLFQKKLKKKTIKCQFYLINGLRKWQKSML